MSGPSGEDSFKGSRVGLSCRSRKSSRSRKWSLLPFGPIPVPSMCEAKLSNPSEMGEERYLVCAQVEAEHLAVATPRYSNLGHNVFRFSCRKCIAKVVSRGGLSSKPALGLRSL